VDQRIYSRLGHEKVRVSMAECDETGVGRLSVSVRSSSTRTERGERIEAWAAVKEPQYIYIYLH
jgi:hypothetical protein